MTCIADWYGEGEAATERKEEIVKTIGEHPSYPPHAVLLAMIQDECGQFPSR